MQGTVASVTGKLEGLPLLPLPEYTLFPHTLAPFHVFEPELRRSVDACLAGERLIVVSGLAPGWEALHPAPGDTHQVCGLGRVVSDRRLEGGRYTLFVHCIDRVKILRERDDGDYRKVDVVPVRDAPLLDTRGLKEVDQRLRSLLTSLVCALGPEGGTLSKVVASTKELGILSFRLAGLLVDDPVARQALLEERCPAVRCEVLADLASARLIEVSKPDGDDVTWVN